MKLITRKTDYAVRALCYLARAEKRVRPVAALVAALRIPRPFLRQILQRLQHGGILASRRGNGGGFALAKPARKIYLMEIRAIFQGPPVVFKNCLFRKRICPNRRRCRLRRRIEEIEKEVADKLNAIRLADLLPKY